MRPWATALLGVALLLGSAIAAARTTEKTPSPATETAFVRGVALGLFATDSDWDYGSLVSEIAERGATDVLIVVNAYQSNRFTSDIDALPGKTPTETAVARTLRQVASAGMRAAVMPVVRLRERTAREWRGVIAPADGLDAWFSAYRRFVLPLARIAEAERAHRFVVGSELSSLEPYESAWRALVRDVRGEFSGRVTYSANWDHAAEVPFWDALDEVGLTAYFPLSPGGASEPDLAAAWRDPLREIRALGERAAKPVLVTEIGYASQSSAAARPWDEGRGEVVDLRTQQELYRGFCDAFAETPTVSGFYVWNWFGVGGPRDAGFTPRGKPAATELAKCFSRAWPDPAVVGNDS